MFLNISFTTKKARYIVSSIFIIICTIIILMLINIYKLKNGIRVKNKADLSFKTYYVDYDMTVISNKNINTYNVKEWHEDGVMTKLEYLDYSKNVVTITIENNHCYISNSGNAAKLVINNMFGNRNICSLSTFAYLYSIVNNTCGCYKTEYEKYNESNISINFKKDCNCKCNEIIEGLGITKLELVLVNGIPKNYTIYDKNKNEYISIVYNVFEKK